MAERPAGDASARSPSLLRLLFAPRSEGIPYIAQTTALDCGPACLAMVLAYRGKQVNLEQIRELSGEGRDGTLATSLIQAARALGLRGQAVRIGEEALHLIPRASILFWRFSHYVVFDRLTRKGARIIDPAVGPRVVPLESFRRSFTGISLVFEPDDTFEKSKLEKKSYHPFLARIFRRRSLIATILATSVAVQLLALAVPVITGAIVDRVVPRQDYSLLLLFAVGMGAVTLAIALTSLVRSHFSLHLQTYLDSEMTLSFLYHLVSLPYSFFQLRSAGDLMMRLNSNTAVRQILTDSAISGLLDGSLVLLYVGLLFFMSPSIALLALLLAAMQVVALLLVRKKRSDLMTESLEKQAGSQSYQVELLTGIETVKAMGAEYHAAAKWSNRFSETLEVSLRLGRLSANFGALMGALGTLSPAAILLFGTSQVLQGRYTLGVLMGIAALAGAFFMPLGKLVNAAFSLQSLGSYFSRIYDVLEKEPEQIRAQVKLTPPLRGRIELESVSFRYSPSSDWAVKDVSICIERGQMVGIVGASGSGKSTLARLIMGLYRPNEGRILFDGQDQRGLDCTSLRSQMGVVTQDTVLFFGSIRDNIALVDPTCSLDEIVWAAKMAGLHDDIVNMPMGYETQLVDRGLSLSGGQRQRLALARALVHHPRILLLDEATSSLDSITEKRIQRSLEELNCTRIVVAHRLSTVAKADDILVLERGSVIERGTHEQLLAQGRAYATLAAAQHSRSA